MNVEIGLLLVGIGAIISISLIWLAVEKIVWLLKKPAERAIINLERNFKQQCDLQAKHIIQRKKDEVRSEIKNKNCVGYILTRTAEERAADYAEEHKLQADLATMESIKQREELEKYKKKYPNEFYTE